MKCIDCNGEGFVVALGCYRKAAQPPLDICPNCRGSGELPEVTIGVGFRSITIFDHQYNSLPITDIREILRQQDIREILCKRNEDQEP